MKIAVLGTGAVGRAISGRLAELGHEVTIGTRDPDATRSRTDDDGVATFAAWESDHPALRLETFAPAAATAELVINAASGNASLEVLEQAGTENLAGKVLLDISNPLDFSAGFPPSLFTTRESLAEQVQAALPHAAVVKALNTVNATVMVQPSRVPGVTLPIAGDDEAAKQQVRSLLRELGWPEEDVLDLGPLSAARATEAYVLYWVALFSRFGSPDVGTRVLSA